jgi:hypothetical protein
VFPCIELLAMAHQPHRHTEVPDQRRQWRVCRVFLPVEVQNYYKLRDPEERLNTDFIVKFYEHHDTGWVMDSWWREDKKYTNQTFGWYQMTNLRESYIYLMTLICQLYGEKYCSRFSEAWMPLAYTVAISGRGFNWGAIISKQLEHFHTTGSDAERRRDSILLHGFLFIGRHLRHKCLCWNEIEMGCLRTPDPCIFQRPMGKLVQKILLPHLRWIHRTHSFYSFQERVSKTIGCSQKDDIKGWPLVSG